MDPAGTARTRLLGPDPDGWHLLPVADAPSPDEHDLPPEELHLAWEAASWPEKLSGPERRALALLLATTAQAVQRGSTRLPLDEAGAVEGLGVALGLPQADRLAACALATQLATGDVPGALSDLIGRDGERRPYVVACGCLYQHRLLLLERNVADLLRRRLDAPPLDASDALVQATLDRLGDSRPLSPTQRSAVRHAVGRSLAVITGGPGTGKTSIVAAVVHALAALGISPSEIALAAPTGKAAQRMGEALRAATGALTPATPCTLHRLLGYDPSSGHPRHDQTHPVPHRAVIVDEGSMIDLPLMEALLRAVPATSRLIVLGDADQLPPVGTGDAFRALTPLAVRLDRSYRLDPADEDGSQIMRTALAVAAGRSQDLDLTEVGRADHLRFRGLELLALPDDPRQAEARRREFLCAWHHRWLKPAGVEAAPADAAVRQLALGHRVRLLCLTRGPALSTGAAAINQQLGELMGCAPHGDVLHPGTPIIVERNDYSRGLWNGDHGVIARRASGMALDAVFQGADAPLSFPLDAIQFQVSPAWAITVHKAQGSEHDGVAVILPDHDMPLLGRQALYTALTRARRSVVVVGRRALFERAIGRTMQRWSGLTGLIERPPNSRPE